MYTFWYLSNKRYRKKKKKKKYKKKNPFTLAQKFDILIRKNETKYKYITMFELKQIFNYLLRCQNFAQRIDFCVTCFRNTAEVYSEPYLVSE